MKNIIFIFLLLAAYVSEAQSQYNFSTRVEAYTPITGGTEILPGTKFNDTIAAGYDIKLAGIANDSLFISSTGVVNLGDPASAFTAFYAEMQDGKKYYKVTGNPGERVFTIEFSNVRFSHDFTQQDYVSFQLRMYEKNNAVEVHIGNNSVNGPQWAYYYNNGGPAIGFKTLWVKGAHASPAADTAFGYVSGTPSSGRVYRFEPKGSGIEEATAQTQLFQIAPNPAGDEVKLIFTTREKGSIRLLNMTGQVLYQKDQQTATGSITIPLHDRPAGLYIAEWQTGNARHAAIIIKK